MDKRKSLAIRLKELKQLAFRRKKILKEVVTTLDQLAREQDDPWADHLLNLLTIPYTLWSSDYQGLAEHICEMLAARMQPTEQMKRILTNYGELPSDELTRVITEDEHEVQDGNYDQYLTPLALAKYDTANKLMLADPDVHAEVADFFRRNPTFGGDKNVIRRRKCMERNFRQPGWQYDSNNPKHLTLIEFDSLCYKYMLYGVERMENGFTPLLQKLSVNATPYGLMIFIPRYWSLDSQRDIQWGALKRVLKAWGIKRQGIKWGATRVAATEESKLAALAYDEATDKGMTGKKRYDHVKAKAGLNPDMDAGTLHRVVRAGQALLKKTKGSKKK